MNNFAAALLLLRLATVDDAKVIVQCSDGIIVEPLECGYIVIIIGLKVG